MRLTLQGRVERYAAGRGPMLGANPGATDLNTVVDVQLPGRPA